MRIFNKFKGTKGFISTYNRVLRFRDMITNKAQHKARVLTFWAKHGLKATKDAYNISRPTLYRWKQKLKQGKGRLEFLNDGKNQQTTKEEKNGRSSH